MAPKGRRQPRATMCFVRQRRHVCRKAGREAWIPAIQDLQTVGLAPAAQARGYSSAPLWSAACVIETASPHPAFDLIRGRCPALRARPTACQCGQGDVKGRRSSQTILLQILQLKDPAPGREAPDGSRGCLYPCAPITLVKMKIHVYRLPKVAGTDCSQPVRCRRTCSACRP